GGVRHILFDDLADSERGVELAQAERFADRFVDRSGGARYIQLNATTRKIVRIEPAEDDVGVRHSGFGPAATIAGGPWFGARAPRTDIYTRKSIYRRDRAATGTDLHHLDHGNAQWQAAPFEEAILPRDLECARVLRFAIVDQANLCRCATHVE